ncbi:MAG: glycine zipper 2TM domain-containing protein [Sphingomonadales bacterium]|nr:glycine zipper 2TM domain-containing protein [Sphingomonadales bacterium]
MPQMPAMPGAVRAPDTRPVWKEARPDAAPGWGADYARQRDQWLVECRRRMGGDRVAGAAVGGILGGILGNRIAGRHDRTVGTIAGAVVGGVAGAAVDGATDRRHARDYCESYLDQYSQPAYAPGYGQPVYGYAYVVPMMMVPAVQPQQTRNCHTTVTRTYEYVTVPVRTRYIHTRTRIIRDKRVRMVPDKRIPMK